MNINQKYIDLHLLCCSGYGNVDYAYDDCKIIQKAIHDGFGVTLSIAECYTFWHWRSEQYDASFLSVGDTEGHVSDIQEWFVDWLKETDYTASCELFEEIEKPVEKSVGERGEELKAFVNAMTPEQMQETMEKFRAFMPQRIKATHCPKCGANTYISPRVINCSKCTWFYIPLQVTHIFEKEDK